jgi:hypothetical protein
MHNLILSDLWACGWMIDYLDKRISVSDEVRVQETLRWRVVDDDLALSSVNAVVEGSAGCILKKSRVRVRRRPKIEEIGVVQTGRSRADARAIIYLLYCEQLLTCAQRELNSQRT